jgi:hypothetical protein
VHSYPNGTLQEGGWPSPQQEGQLVSDAAGAVRHALGLAAAMGWEILWALILGFVLSAIQSVVSKH